MERSKGAVCSALFGPSWYQDKHTLSCIDPKLGEKAKLAEIESGRQGKCLDNVASVVSVPSSERIYIPFVVEICRVGGPAEWLFEMDLCWRENTAILPFLCLDS